MNELTTQLTVATCQFPVSGDIDQNAGWIIRQMNEAADRGARVAHFPEGPPNTRRLTRPRRSPIQASRCQR